MKRLSGILGAVGLLTILAALGTWVMGVEDVSPDLLAFFAVICGLLSAAVYPRPRHP